MSNKARVRRPASAPATLLDLFDQVPVALGFGVDRSCWLAGDLRSLALELWIKGGRGPIMKRVAHFMHLACLLVVLEKADRLNKNRVQHDGQLTIMEISYSTLYNC